MWFFIVGLYSSRGRGARHANGTPDTNSGDVRRPRPVIMGASFVSWRESIGLFKVSFLYYLYFVLL